jgi:hypothetical protein
MQSWGPSMQRLHLASVLRALPLEGASGPYEPPIGSKSVTGVQWSMQSKLQTVCNSMRVNSLDGTRIQTSQRSSSSCCLSLSGVLSAYGRC